MNADIVASLTNAVWPAALAFAWLTAELLFRRLAVPRLASYAMVGFAYGQLPLPAFGAAVGATATPAVTLAAYVALGLFLFELGCRVNLSWFRHNPMLLLTGVLESLATFAASYAAMIALGLSDHDSLVIGALCAASSPVAVLRVTLEANAAGQLTDRIMHLTAINVVVSIVVLKMLIGHSYLAAGDWTIAAWTSVTVLLASSAAGCAFGLLTPWLLVRVAGTRRSAPALLAVAVALLTTLADALTLSPLLAALAFGLTLRLRSSPTTLAERGFGLVADLLALFLFVFAASLLTLAAVIGGFVAGTLLLLIRLLTKVGLAAALARPSGTTLRKGALTGLALAPLSALPILLAEHSRVYGFSLGAEAVAALSAMVLLLDLLGPFATRLALLAAGEGSARKDL